MKKNIIFFIIALMFISSISVFAEESILDYEEFIIKEYPIVYSEKSKSTADSNEKITKKDIDNEFKKITKKFNEDKSNFTDAKQKKALKIAQELENAGIFNANTSTNNLALSASYYDENRAKLREANFIEGILDAYEGLSSSEVVKIGVTHASTAKTYAKKQYPKDAMLQDACRHFCWNNISTKDLGATKTRTATINHEWGLLLLQPCSDYYDQQFSKYKKQGYSDKNASDKAYADTISYIPTSKENIITVCKSNYAFFKSFFSKANIMDLHNNCFGRAYATNYSKLSHGDAFNKAKSNKELILNETSVTDYSFKYVWSNNWYTY